MKVLVVFYSRTGNTRRLAQRIAVALNAEMEEIIDKVDRKGLFGYLRSGNEGWFRQRTEILPERNNPDDFDLVVIGTPVWRVSLSSPVRTYLEENRIKLKQVAFFCTMGGFGGSGRVFRQMKEASGKAPLATLARTERQMTDSDLSDEVKSFVSKLHTSTEKKKGGPSGPP